MTIEEVIEHCDKTVNLLERAGQTNNKQYEEHLLVRDCLRELSRRRVEELFRKTDEKAIRDKAIDDFVKMAYEELLYSERLTEIDIDYIAEQLKAGISDGNI